MSHNMLTVAEVKRIKLEAQKELGEEGKKRPIRREGVLLGEMHRTQVRGSHCSNQDQQRMYKDSNYDTSYRSTWPHQSRSSVGQTPSPGTKY